MCVSRFVTTTAVLAQRACCVEARSPEAYWGYNLPVYLFDSYYWNHLHRTVGTGERYNHKHSRGTQTEIERNIFFFSSEECWCISEHLIICAATTAAAVLSPQSGLQSSSKLPWVGNGIWYGFDLDKLFSWVAADYKRYAVPPVSTHLPVRMRFNY